MVKKVFDPPKAIYIYDPYRAKNINVPPMAKNTFNFKGRQTKFLENGDNNKSNPLKREPNSKLALEKGMDRPRHH